MNHLMCVALFASAGWLISACDTEGSPLPIGATCSISAQCESGICGGNTCLDPEVDTDGDNLLNRVEAALGTDPVSTDTDGDGEDDFTETGNGNVDAPPNFDGDGRNDAVESMYLDVDGDCIPDERDANDLFKEADLAVVADRSCCCDGLCSEQDLMMPTAQCVPVSGGSDLTCMSSADCDDGGTCDPQTGRCVWGEASARGASEVPAGASTGAAGEVIAQQQQMQLICTVNAQDLTPYYPCGGRDGGVDTSTPEGGAQ